MKLPRDPDWLARAVAEGRAVEGPRPRLPVPDCLTRPVSEKAFQGEVLRLAREHGWRCYHAHDSRRSERGFPDLVMVRDGVLVFAELKVPPNVATAEQLCWLDDLKAVRDVATGLWFPEQWADIVRTLR